MENLREKKQEKIDGKFYDMSPAADYRHSLVNGNIFYRLRGQFQDSLCAIFMENLDFCYCEDSEDYVIPDIMIICDRKNLKKGTYRGIPKFIVETLSPSTAFRDRTKKKEDVYMAAYLDPHTSAELSMDEIRALCDELIDAHGKWLPKLH